MRSDSRQLAACRAPSRVLPLPLGTVLPREALLIRFHILAGSPKHNILSARAFTRGSEDCGVRSSMSWLTS